MRRHGEDGPLVVVLHGGPAAAGSAGAVARGLADGFRVLEPWQRGSGGPPLTVDGHVADLLEVAAPHEREGPPALVGLSWGAMLALAFAAAHPEAAGPLVLVGCGTFDPASRARLAATVDDRLGARGRARRAALEREVAAGRASPQAIHDLLRPAYEVDALPEEPDPEADALPFDARAHEETWADMLRCQAEGLYPKAFAAVRSPVLMVHGAWDPHPGRAIREGLLPFLPRLEYLELPRCGHEPWRERAGRAPFFAAVREALLRTP